MPNPGATHALDKQGAQNETDVIGAVHGRTLGQYDLRLGSGLGQPPGYAFQRRGIIDSSGLNPNRYYRGYGGAYSAYGYAAAPRYYGYGRDDPPGSAFQDRGNDEDLGRDTLRWR